MFFKTAKAARARDDINDAIDDAISLMAKLSAQRTPENIDSLFTTIKEHGIGLKPMKSLSNLMRGDPVFNTEKNRALLLLACRGYDERGGSNPPYTPDEEKSNWTPVRLEAKTTYFYLLQEDKSAHTPHNLEKV